MRLVNARFKNFRLLTDLKLDFSTDAEKKLTVIRAANETGKTTIMTALQWALYGDESLPGKASDYRLHPINWDVAADGNRVPISVEVTFEVIKYNRMQPSRRRYHIIRSATEEINGAIFHRGTSGVRLLQITDTGSSPISDPETTINDELPKELRDVFFTDGDRALSFIEANVSISTKRDRVNRAIRSLMGLGVIEDSIKHLKKAEGDVNKQVRQIGAGTDLAKVGNRVASLEDEIVKLDDEIDRAKQSFFNFDEKLTEVDHRISETLKKGDQEKLNAECAQIEREITRLRDQKIGNEKEHSALLKHESLAFGLLTSVIDKASDKLDKLKDENKIPNTTIPVLEERLLNDVCICGESLKDDGADGTRRRSHIANMIEESQQADALQSTLADLYYDLRAVRSRMETGNNWIDLFKNVANRNQELDVRLEDAKRKQGALELRIDSLKDTDIQVLRQAKRDYQEQRDRFKSEQAVHETRQSGVRKDLESAKNERERLLKAQTKGNRILCDLDVITDIKAVLDAAYRRITSEELAEVSRLMNVIFLQMIGADPQQNAIIKKAEISSEFDILVVGPENRKLDPDRDLNGASRRALTLAFILALTKVSDVEAPNVIDTPLGMMSGYVKKSVLRTAIEHSSQLILFLTHSEIEGCEEILDEYAGVVTTLTNTTHYPRMLVNDPGVERETVLRCGCNHRTHCRVCERRDVDDDIAIAS
jgi:DNA sulfur modification protein DndD